MDEEIGGAAARQVTAPPHPLCSELVWGVFRPSGVARISFDFGRRAIQEATSCCAGRVLILLDFERASTKLKSPLFDFDTAIWSGGLG